MAQRKDFQLQVAVNKSDHLLLRDVLASEPDGWIELLESEQLKVALYKLTVRQREIIRLKYIEGYSTVEIARQNGTTERAVNLIITRGLKKIKNVF